MSVTMAAKASKMIANGDAKLDAEFIFGVVLELVGVDEEDVLVAEDARWISRHTLNKGMGALTRLGGGFNCGIAAGWGRCRRGSAAGGDRSRRSSG